MQRPSLPTANLHWDDAGHPVSRSHNDVYYSRESGIDESQYVFLDNNQVKQRLLNVENQTNFTIAEIGFGTGLNFLCSWMEWKKTSQTSSTLPLHFISVEKWPLCVDDLKKALSNWSQLSDMSQQLIKQYPLPVQGCHRLVFEHGRVTLDLYFGDAEEQYRKALFLADAWFLDGFAPHKDPEMWSDGLFETIGSHSAPQATFSTFSIAGRIRRGMAAAGYSIVKVAGFGRKKEMLTGYLPDSDNQSDINRQIDTSWLKGCLGTPRNINQAEFNTIIVGAGLSGTTTAHALAERGQNVLVIEKGGEPATGGSGNPQGALYNKFSTEFNIPTAYALGNLLFSQAYFQRIQSQLSKTFWSPCGVIQVGCNPKEANKQSDLLANNHYPKELVEQLSADKLSELAGIPLPYSGLYFPASGWVSPKILCQLLVDHPRISTHYNTQVTQLVYDQPNGHWSVLDSHNTLIATANNVVVCSASDAKSLDQLSHLKTKPIRGQVSLVASKKEFPLKTVLCGEGYISPQYNGQFCFGATFDLKNSNCEVRDEDHQINIRQLTSWLTSANEVLAPQNTTTLEGRASIRCTSPDYLPIVGKAPDFEQQIERFARLRYDANHHFEYSGAYHEGLFVNIAHGSKGLSSCPLAAEFVASQICNEPSPLTVELVKAISPSRFIIRDLIRRKR